MLSNVISTIIHINKILKKMQQNDQENRFKKNKKITRINLIKYSCKKPCDHYKPKHATGIIQKQNQFKLQYYHKRKCIN